MSFTRMKSSWQQEKLPKHVSGDPLAIIYNEGLWRVSKASPLYNLQYSTLKLKQYGSKIKQALVSAVPASSSVKYSVQLEEQPLLKYCEEDSSALMITVSATRDSNKSKVAYVALLLSWGMCSALDNAVHLPYLLERGEQKLGTSVKATLQTVFDSIITPFSFTQHQLLQFGFNFVENDSSRSTDPFSMTYRTPQADHKNKLNLAFEVGDINIIWNGIKDETLKSSELVNLAYQILQNQIFHMIMLDITVFDLCEVNLPKAEVKSNGTVKMKTPETVNSVLTVLNEISNVQIHEELSVSE